MLISSGWGLAGVLGVSFLILWSKMLGDRKQKIHVEKELLAKNKKIKEIEGEKKELEEKLDTVLSSMHEGIVILNQKNHLLFYNDRFIRMFQVSFDETSSSRLLDASKIPEIRRLIYYTRQNQKELTQTVGFELYDTEIQVEVQTIPTQFRGEPATVLLLHDITSLKNSEKARRDFIANASHQLKTPLAVIQGYVETMVEDPQMDEKVRQKFLQQIVMRTQEMTTMIVRLVELSKIETEVNVLEKKRVALRSAVERKLSGFDVLLKQKEIRSELSIDPSLVIHVAPSLLDLVLENLIDNAIKFVPKKGHILVKAYEENEEIVLSVVDSGVGIPKDEWARIFDRFYKSSHTSMHNPTGTGIGLAMVKSAVAQMGGKITVHSEKEKGTEFQLRFEKERAS
ncbi:MAG: PAS domain-containing sensor histidine kinase [Bdellovibrionota bacterium]